MSHSPPAGPWTRLPWFMATLPQRRPSMLERPRVTTALEQAITQSPLVVVVAPSGHGKSTAVAAWARDRDDVVWISASAATDSHTIVRGCLLEALAPVVQTQLAALDPLDAAPNPLELIAQLTDPRVLIIDDAHLLDPHVVRHTIASEPALATGLIRVVLIGQPALGNSFSRELGAGLARSVTSRELAFSLDEVSALLRMDGGTPEDGSAEDLLRRSGGWPVGLHLLRRGGKDHPGAPTGQNIDGEWTQEAVDYVEQAVLGHLAPDVQTFVLEAATSGRTTASLARLITGRADSSALLAECLRDGLFLERFTEPGHEETYRWHDTFVSLARTLRMRRDAERCRALHRLAAEAMMDKYPGAAVEQALLADDPDLAAEIIRATWLGFLLSSQASALDQLCLALPQRLQESADILLIRACCCDILGERNAAATLRDRAHTSSESDQGASELVRLLAALYLLSDPQQKADAADRAYEALAKTGETQADPYAAFLLGWVELRLRRDPERAVESLASAVRVARARGLTELAARAHANLAFALSYAGHFAAADAALQEINPARITRGDWEVFDGGLSLFSRGHNHFHRGDLTSAFEYFTRMVTDGGNDGSFLGLGRVYFTLTACALGRSDVYDEAEYNLSRVSAHDRHGVPWGSYKRLAAARLLEARGNTTAARQLAEPLVDRRGLPVVHSMLAELYRRLGDPTLAHVALNRIERQARPRYTHVSALVTTAALRAERGRHEDAHRLLERALIVGASDSAWFPFVAPDPVITELLESHARSGRTERALAEIFELRAALRQGPGLALTAREQEILTLLRTSMTTLEIGQQLHISPNTVKTHLRAIYRKLDVPNRRSAVRLMS